MEMILGALGRDAIGLGSSIAHPRESEEWKAMSLDQKYEFFAPIWRVMRDDAMPVEEVRRQVEYVALAVKQGSQVSDMRKHRFTGRLLSARVVYFRAGVPGACDYVNDSRFWSWAHGICWQDLCTDLQVIDVPGDHFSLLRQGVRDMSYMVSALKLHLGAFGWAETLRRDVPAAAAGGAAAGGGWQLPAEEVDGLAEYLERMGVDASRAQQLAGTAPYGTSGAATGAAGGGVGGAASAGLGDPALLSVVAAGETAGQPGITFVPLNAAAASALSPPSGARTAAAAAAQSSASSVGGPLPGLPGSLEGVDVVFVIPDAGQRLPPALEAAVSGLGSPCFSLLLPPNSRLSQIRSAQALAQHLVLAARAAVKTLAAPPASAAASGAGRSSHRRRPASNLRRLPAGPAAGGAAVAAASGGGGASGATTGRTLKAAVVGVGFAAAVAYEVAVQLQSAAEAPTSATSGLHATVLVLLEDPRLRRCCEVVSQPWFQLRDWVAGWRQDLDLVEFAAVGRLLEEQGHSAQIEYVGGLAPPGIPRDQWEVMAEEQARAANARSGYAWEELQYSWAVLYGMIEALHQQEGIPRGGAASGGGSASASASVPASACPTASSELMPPPHPSASASGSGSATCLPLPEWETFLLDLYGLVDRPEAQLDYLAGYRPPGGALSEMGWDTAVRDTLWTASYLKSIAHTHKPELPFVGETLFLHAAPPNAGVISGAVRDFMGGWAAGATRSFALLVQPLRLVRLPLAGTADAAATGTAAAVPEEPSGTGSRSASADTATVAGAAPVAGVAAALPPPPPELPLNTEQLRQLLGEAAASYSRLATMRQQLAEVATTTGTPLLPLLPYNTTAVRSDGGGGGGGTGTGQESSAASMVSYVLVSAGRTRSSGGGSGTGSGGPASTASVAAADAAVPAVTIAALNRLCPMGQSYRPGAPGAAAMSLAGPAAPPPPGLMQTSQPVWLLHDETGSTSGAVRSLAELLNLPVYGINLPDLSPSGAASAGTTVAGEPASAAIIASGQQQQQQTVTSPRPHTAAAVQQQSGSTTSITSMDKLAELYCAAVLAAQPHGPYCLAATSAFGCMAAFAMAVSLEQQGHDVMLVLLDGPPGPPATSIVDPAYCSLYQTLVQHAVSGSASGGGTGAAAAVAAIAGGADSAAAVSPPQQQPAQLPDLATFVATLQSRGAAPDDAAAMLVASGSFRPAGLSQDAWSAAVLGAVRRAVVLRTLLASHRPVLSLAGPAAVVLPEDRYGAAFLTAARQCCDGTLTAMTLECRHGTALATEEGRRAAAAAVMEAVCEMLQML